MGLKLKVFIEEELAPRKNDDPTKVVVTFDGDKEKYRHEIYFFEACPFQLGLRKWTMWIFDLKWKSITFTEQDGSKSYQTILYCNKIIPMRDNKFE